MSPSPGISAFPDGDDLTNWTATIVGPDGTPYEKLNYKLALKFPSDYPYAPPHVHFKTKVYHPNVDLPSGAICLDILKDKWSAVYTVGSVLISLQSLLGEPNNASPLNEEAASIWSQPEEMRKRVVAAHPGNDE
ncbi:Ubiquitin-conjugating enzyme E2 11 [Thoreauomyces humboldtii]|nr:Ubiquitin-conjugating enzyme E2 11 [Thoreauomyces humboldtii]